jgi:hypothetical protein
MQLKKPEGAWRKGAAVLVAVSTAAGMMLAQVGAASASSTGQGNQSSPTVNVGATVSGGSDPSAAPTIECSWVLTDDNHLGGQETQQYSYAVSKDIGPYASLSYTNFTQPAQSLGAPTSGTPSAPSYGGGPNAAQSFVYGLDDNPSSYPSTPPCTSPNTAASQPSQATGTMAAPVSTGVSVLPNAFDSPSSSAASANTAPRRMEVWAAVDNATSVMFNVWYPNGQEDTDLGGVLIGKALSACSTYGASGSLLTNMFAAAGPAPTGANELSANAISNSTGTGIVNLCNDNEKDLWYQAFTISKDDPSGTYVIQVIATNSNGNSSSYISFYVIPFFDLAIDFTSVNFTSNGATPPVYFVSGDTSWDPGATPQLPTVTNGGNSGEEIGVNFSTLTCQSCTGSPGYISKFDAALGYNDSNISSEETFAAGSTAWIGSDGVNTLATNGQLVCPNDTPKLDLSMEPPSGVQNGTYSGTMTVQAESDVVLGSGNGGCVTDNGSPYVLPGPPPAFKSLTDNDPNPIVRS